ncbi:hypothetical protein ABEB36_014792 [Hypothenemus hampei]|uniref:FAD dependent oxidoreductase domain-containing protein n=1 Tax=Hypothenemus hampei TaxID=57062 RepID=A0ABD1E0W7_HYPHA
MFTVAVVGSGAIGLTTAIELLEKLGNFIKVTIVADKFSPNTTSDIAAGLWEPYLLAENSEEDILRWGGETYQYLIKLFKQGRANEAGICLQPIVNLFTKKEYSVPKWVRVTLGFNELSQCDLESFSKQYGRTFTAGFMFVGFTWEAAIFLPYLQRQFLEMNGTIIERHIEKLNELKEFDAIVNCTGFGARILCSDEAVLPIRGQITRVQAPWQYFTYLVQCDEEEDSCYIIPNRDFVILGGTKQRSFNTHINPEDDEKIMRNATKLIPAIASSKTVKRFVGLRPSRIRVRLEVDISDGLKIVHNYGHGGAGITLSIGCAKETTNLVAKILNIQTSKL